MSEKNSEKNSAPEKNSAAVEMGKRRQAKMTAEERAAFVRAGGLATARRRTPDERKRISRKAAQTRRKSPAWMRRKQADAAAIAQADAAVITQADAAVITPGLADLDRAIDQLDDQTIVQLFESAIRLIEEGRIPTVAASDCGPDSRAE